MLSDAELPARGSLVRRQLQENVREIGDSPVETEVVLCISESRSFSWKDRGKKNFTQQMILA